MTLTLGAMSRVKLKDNMTTRKTYVTLLGTPEELLGVFRSLPTMAMCKYDWPVFKVAKASNQITFRVGYEKGFVFFHGSRGEPFSIIDHVCSGPLEFITLVNACLAGEDVEAIINRK